MVTTVTTYPTEEQADRWDDRAEALGMTRSDWVSSMVEAGIKAAEGFEPGVDADESAAELREQRNELAEELERARSRVEELEGRVYGAERREAVEFVSENPGCTHAELVNHLQATVAERVQRLAADLVCDERPDGGEGYYVPGDEGEQATGGGPVDYVAGSGHVTSGAR